MASLFSAIRDGILSDFKAAGRVVTYRRSGPNPATEPKEESWYDFWHRSVTNLAISEETALEVPAVYAAVSLVSSTIAALPIDVFQLILGARVPVDNPTSQLLTDTPNPEMTARSFWETLVIHELLYGNAFIFVVSAGNGQPLELWPIDPKRVRVGRAADRGKYYAIDEDVMNNKVMFDYRKGGEIIHVANMSIDGLKGTSPIQKLKEAIALAKASEEYSARFFSQNATPSGTLTTDQTLTVEQATDLKRRWMAEHTGLSNAQNISVLSNGAKYQPISSNPEDSQLLEQRRFQIGEVERIYRTPPHLLADVDRSTSWGSGIEEQARNFVEFTLNPHLSLFEHAININLLRKQETGRYMKFNVNGLLRADTFKRFQTHKIAIESGIETINEVRSLEDLPKVPGFDELTPSTAIAVPPPAVEEEAEPAA